VVRVPSSYYKRHYDEVAARGEPSAGDLIAFERKTQASIRSAVAMAVPPDELGEVEVDRIFPSEPPAAAPVPRRTVPPLAAWTPVLAVGGGLMVFALAALGRRWRRPASGSAAPRGSRRVRIDAAGGDPAARVRELVRLDPAAAAGVLQRWIGQAGEGQP
jgi:hypothetical protein